MIPVLIVLATLASYAVGWIAGRPILLPLFNAAASFPFMVAALRRGDLRLAVARMLLWALTMAVAATALSYVRPQATARLFLRADSYRAEMFAWVLTGRGAESTPSTFIPQQAGQAGLFAIAALATGGAVAMPMGAVLMNYMGHYVGTLAAASRQPAATLILAWHPWAVIRVISFVAIGVVLSIPVLGRFFDVRIDRREALRLSAGAGAGLIADIVLKSLAAPAWQRLLVRVVGW
jgi:hypothetical protein